jgi:hypothetical protein
MRPVVTALTFHANSSTSQDQTAAAHMQGLVAFLARFWNKSRKMKDLRFFQDFHLVKDRTRQHVPEDTK